MGYLITVSWPKEMKDDIDVYVKDPLGNLIYFKNKEAGLMHLDRDDLGHKNDIINTSGGSIEYNENREVVTLRGVYSGEYIINIHAYAKYSSHDIPVEVEIEKLNPYKRVLLKTVAIAAAGEEKTVCRLRMNTNKEVESINYLYKKLIGGDRGIDDYRGYIDDYLNGY